MKTQSVLLVHKIYKYKDLVCANKIRTMIPNIIVSYFISFKKGNYITKIKKFKQRKQKKKKDGKK